MLQERASPARAALLPAAEAATETRHVQETTVEVRDDFQELEAPAKKEKTFFGRKLAHLRSTAILNRYKAALTSSMHPAKKFLLLTVGAVGLAFSLLASLVVEVPILFERVCRGVASAAVATVVGISSAVAWVGQQVVRGACCCCRGCGRCCGRYRRLCCIVGAITIVGTISVGVLYLTCKEKGLEQCFKT